MTVSERGDHEQALALARAVPNTPGISRWNLVHAEWAIATITHRTGDIDAARKLYKQLLERYEPTGQYDWIILKTKEQLNSL